MDEEQFADETLQALREIAALNEVRFIREVWTANKVVHADGQPIVVVATEVEGHPFLQVFGFEVDAEDIRLSNGSPGGSASLIWDNYCCEPTETYEEIGRTRFGGSAWVHVARLWDDSQGRSDQYGGMSRIAMM